ncbi:hypothetical protein [Bosea thiooxidans]
MTQKAEDSLPLAGDSDGDDGPQRPLSPLEIASFVEGMAAEMRTMTREAKLNALSYFLEMVRVEASAEIERLAKAVDRAS